MRYSTLLLAAVVATTSSVSAAPSLATQFNALVELRDESSATALTRRYIHVNHPTSEIRDLILLPNGQLISKRDPAWNSATAEAAYKTCSVLAGAAALACKAAGHDTASYALGGVALAAGGAEAAVKIDKAAKDQKKNNPVLPTTNTYQRPVPNFSRPLPAKTHAHRRFAEAHPLDNVVLTFPEF